MKKTTFYCVQVVIITFLNLFSANSFAGVGEYFVKKADLNATASNIEAVKQPIENRRALVGPHCFVNNTVHGISVVSVCDNIENITDENLSNYGTIGTGVGATLGASAELLGVRDMEHYYTGGTQVGFALSEGKNFNVLELDIVKAYAIWIYKDGEFIKSLTPSKGQSAGGIGLHLLQIPRSENISFEICADVPATDDDGNPILYDEVRLIPAGGLDLSVANSFNIQYAFVGKPKEITMTRNGFNTYATSAGQSQNWHYHVWGSASGHEKTWDISGDDEPETSLNLADFADDDLTNHCTLSAFIDVAQSADVGFCILSDDGKEVFPKGSMVGFNFGSNGALKLGVADLGYTIATFGQNSRKNWSTTLAGQYHKGDFKECDRTMYLDTETSPATVIGLDVAEAKDGSYMIEATQPFSAALFWKNVAIEVNLGGLWAYSAFVRLPPDVEHHCYMNLSSNQQICACEGTYELSCNIPAKWYVEEQNSAGGTYWQEIPLQSIGTSNPLTGEQTYETLTDSDTGEDLQYSKTTVYVLPDDAEGRTFRFRAVAEDGCEEITTLKYGIEPYNPASQTNTIYYLTNTAGKDPQYKVAQGQDTGGLLTIATGMHATGALVTPTLRDYSYNNTNVSLAANSCLAAVKRIDGKHISDYFPGKTKRIGFVVKQGTSVLSADVLNFMNIRVRDAQGQNVYNHAIERGWNTISLGIAGGNNNGQEHLYIEVPTHKDDGTPIGDFDTVELYTSGVLGANLEQIKIFYAYVEDGTVPSGERLLDTDIIVADNTTNATIDYEHSTLVSVATVGNGLTKITNLIDNIKNKGIETVMTYPTGIEVGGSTIAINLGKVVKKGQQINFIMKDLELGLGAQVAGVLKVQTFRHDENGKIIQKPKQSNAKRNGAVKRQNASGDVEMEDEVLEEKTDWKAVQVDLIGTGDEKMLCMPINIDCDQIRITNAQPVSALKATQIAAITIRYDSNGDGIADQFDESPCGEDLVLQEQKAYSMKTRDYEDCTFVFRRQLNGNKWNSIALPVDLTYRQFEEMFGYTEITRDDEGNYSQHLVPAKLSELHDIIKRPNGDHVIMFQMKEPDQNDENAVFMHRDKPYILYIDEKALGKDEDRVQTYDEGEVYGPYYIANAAESTGVSLLDHGARMVEEEEFDHDELTDKDFDNVTFHANYEEEKNLRPQEAIISGKVVLDPDQATYVFSNGDLYHITSPVTMLGYRGYITTWSEPGLNAKLTTTAFEDMEETTYVVLPSVKDQNADKPGIYNLQGQRVSLSDLPTLQGVYVMNGKKVVIK